MKKLFAIILAGILFMPVFCFAETKIFGETSNDVDGTYGYSPKIIGAKYTLPEVGSLKSLTFKRYGTGENSKIKLAVYDKNGKFIAETEEKYLLAGSTWHTFNFLSPVRLGADDYFLVIFTENNSTIALRSCSPNCEIIEFSKTYDGFPELATISTSTKRISIYGTYETLMIPISLKSISSTTGVITDLIGSIGPFIWAFMGIPLGFVVVKRIIKIIPK